MVPEDGDLITLLEAIRDKNKDEARLALGHLLLRPRPRALETLIALACVLRE